MSAMRCPYCGSPVVLRSADGIYKENHANTKLYVCSRYPACDAYVRVHEGTNKPVGSLADHMLSGNTCLRSNGMSGPTTSAENPAYTNGRDTNESLRHYE